MCRARVRRNTAGEHDARISDMDVVRGCGSRCRPGECCRCARGLPSRISRALAPWESYRKNQGHELLTIEPPATSAELRTAIRQAAKSNQLRYVVLVGDVRHPNGGSASVVTDQRDDVPTCYVKAQVNVRWGSEPTIATDQLYADVDGDQVPDLAVGRIPAHSPSELSAVVRKIIAVRAGDGREGLGIGASTSSQASADLAR